MDNVKDGVTAGSEEDVHDRARWENSLIDSLKRHRLLFLCFAVAKRMDPATGTIETVTYPDPPSGEEIIFDDLQDDIDRVSQHSQDLNRFYNEAFDRFGSTAKASKDKAAEPRWQLAGSEGWELLEESAKIIRNWCCLILQAGSTPGERTLANEVIAAAFGEGQDVASDDDKLTWWPSKIVPWNYPAKLEELANRLAGVFVPSGSAEAPDSNTEVLASATIATPSAEPSYWNKLSKSMRAIVLLSDHEDWTDEQIARAVPCSRTSLYKWPDYVTARKLLKAKAKKDLHQRTPRGFKSNGDKSRPSEMDAWDYDQEEDDDTTAEDK